MSQVVGMATAYHEHAGISSVICFRIIMHVLPFNKENKQQKTLPISQHQFACVHFVFVCELSSFSRRARDPDILVEGGKRLPSN